MIGETIGSYRVESKLGEGGMGEVYRARDSKLNRDVALKVLPEAFAADADRLARFRREAQVLAALNHPNIAHIHGFEDAGATHAIVMEFVEGPTLADRIAEGPVPIDEIVPIARQMAEALEAAHEAGIVHRDLKPANVKVRADGQVKILDFGLAKALGSPGSEDPGLHPSPSNSPTLTARATQLGMILGTAAYMAPEQAKGRPVDKRADIWAFGVVIHEMLTGERCFKGEDVSETLASVLKDRPSFAALPAATPARLTRLLERCLERDPKERLRDIGEARVELSKIESGGADAAPPSAAAAPVVPPAPSSRAAWIAAAALAVALAGAIVTWAPWTSELLPQPVRFSVVPPPQFAPNTSGTDRDLAISPDGRHVVFVTGGEGRLMVRAADSLEPTPLSDVTGARFPFFSWDGKWVGFHNAGGLNKVAITGGPALRICDTAGAPRGASWGPDDTIVFATAATSSGLLTVPAGGGEPTPVVTELPEGSDALLPAWLPGGRAVLFTISASGVDNNQVAVLDLASGEQKILVRGGGHAEYVESPTDRGRGYLVYGFSGTLRAVPFDPDALEALGDAVPVLDRVTTAVNTGAVNYATSRTGTLIYMPGEATAGDQRALAWVDRQGREEIIASVPPRAYYSLRLSPDGTRVAVESRDEDGDVWIWDLRGEKLSRLTLDAAQDSFPVWMPDSRRIVFRGARGGQGGDLYVQAADGTGVPEPLMSAPGQQTVTSIAGDGSTALVTTINGNEPPFIEALAVEARTNTPLLKPAYGVRNGELSPDGRFVAYESLEAAVPQIFVQPFPDVNGGRWQVSATGGVKPVWSPDGRELFYLGLDRTVGRADVFAVPVAASAAFSPGRPVKVADIWSPAGQGNGRSYDISRDGTRFIAVTTPRTSTDSADSDAREIVFVLNWNEELRAKMGGR